MWQKARFTEDSPNWAGCEIWVEVAPPTFLTGIGEFSRQRIDGNSYKSNLVDPKTGMRVAVVTKYVELMPEFQESIETEHLEIWNARNSRRSQ